MAKTVLPRSWFAVTSLVLWLLSFIPLLWIITGILAIIFGIISLRQIKKWWFIGRKMGMGGIILGILGILFTILLYGGLFYFSFVARTGPFIEMKKEMSRQLLTQATASIELYKKTTWSYPSSLEDLVKAPGFQTVFTSDHYLEPFYYKVSDDGKSFELRSLGPDHQYNTQDDILPLIK